MLALRPEWFPFPAFLNPPADEIPEMSSAEFCPECECIEEPTDDTST